MTDELSEFDRGFNTGLRIAKDYHEKRATALDKCSVLLFELGDTPLEEDMRLRMIGLMMSHRHYSNELWKLRKQTDAEIEFERKMEERYG